MPKIQVRLGIWLLYTKMSLEILLNFDKPTISKGVIDLLQNGLIEDTEQTLSKLSLKECLSIARQGKRLQNAPANYLINSLLRALSFEDSPIEDEIPKGDPLDGGELGNDPTLSQLSKNIDSSGPSQGTNGTTNGTTPATDQQQLPHKNQDDKNDTDKRKKEVCKFYARGHCTRNKDCRFDHPGICKKFRQWGSTSNDPKGCDGKCKAFHPNACRRSVKDKNCSVQDCRFFHLKGTTRLNRNTNGSSSQNWRMNQQPREQGNQFNQNQNQSRPGFESKNGFTSLNNRNPNRGLPRRAEGAHQAPREAKAETVTQQVKAQLGQTLEAILKRLTAMETRQASLPQYLQPIQPHLSPAVPPPGTQTQLQWASQPPWAPTQSQTHY